MAFHIQAIHSETPTFVCGHQDCQPAAEGDEPVMFSSLQEFRKHTQEAHEKNQTFKCSLCDRISASRKALQQHFREMHKKTALERKKHICKFCHHMFTSVSNHVTFSHLT